MSIPIFNAGQGEEAAARAAEQQARSMRQLLTQDMERHVPGALSRATGLVALAREVRGEMLPAAQRLAQTAEAAWLGGELDMTELRDVHKNTRNDAIHVLELEYAARQAHEALRALTLTGDR